MEFEFCWTDILGMLRSIVFLARDMGYGVSAHHSPRCDSSVKNKPPITSNYVHSTRDTTLTLELEGIQSKKVNRIAEAQELSP